MSAVLSEDEKAALSSWDNGAYSCACTGRCPRLPCENDRNDLLATVERIVSARLAECHQRAADHYGQLIDAAFQGKCGHSGLMLASCQASICDCFDMPRATTPDPATPTRAGLPADRQETSE